MEGASEAGRVLVERITALDRSTEPFAAQLQTAFNLVGLRLIESERIFSHELSNDPSLLHFTPKDEWTLRWLLKKLDTRPVQAGGPCTRFESWILLSQLFTKLPVKTIARHIQNGVLTKALLETLNWLRAKLAQKHLTDDDSGDSGSESLAGEALNSQGGAEVARKNRKRKRGASGPSDLQHNEEHFQTKSALLLLFSLARAVESLRTKIASHSAGPEAFAAQHIKSALQSSSERSAQTLGNCCECVLRLAQKVSNQLSIPAQFEAIIEPFLYLWQVRKYETGGDRALTEARAFAKFCLVRLSKLCSLFDRNFEAQRTMEALIVDNCLLLYSSNAIFESKNTIDKRYPREIASGLVSSMFESTEDEGDSGDQIEPVSPQPLGNEHGDETGHGARIALFGDRLEEACYVLPIIFKLTMKIVVGEKKLGSKESNWIQEIFKVFLRTVRLDLEDPSKSTITSFSLDTLDRMLLIFQSHNSSPGIRLLETIILKLCGLSSDPGMERQWKRVKLCADIDYRVMSGTGLEGNELEQSELILQRILAGLSEDGDNTEQKGLESKLRNDSFYSHMMIVLDAFVKGRVLPRFIDIWEQQIATQFKDIPPEKLERTGQMTWDISALFWEVSTRLKSATTASQRSKMFDQRLSRLQEYPSSDSGPGEHFATLTVCSCLLVSLSDPKQPDISLKMALDYHRSTTARLLDRSFPERYKQALWWPLILIYETCPDSRNAEEGVRLLHQLRTLALNTTVGCIEKPKKVAEYENGLSALKFLVDIWPLCYGLDEEDRARFLGSIKAVFESLISSMTVLNSYGSNLKMKTLNQLHDLQGSAWNGEKYSIAYVNQFILASCYNLIRCLSINAIDLALTTEFVERVYVSAFHDLPADFDRKLSRTPSLKEGIRWYSLWDLIRTSEAAKEEPTMNRVIQQVQLQAFFDRGLKLLGESLNGETENKFYEFAVQGIQDLRFDSLLKADRTQLVNQASSILKNGTLDGTCRQSLLYIVLELMRNPNKAMEIATRPALLLEIAEQVDQTPVNIVDELPMLQALTESVVNYTIQNPENPNSITRLKAFQEHAHEKTRLVQPQKAQLAMSTVIASVICSIGKADDNNPLVDVNLQKEFVSCQIRVLLDLWTRETQFDQRMLVTLEIIALLRKVLPIVLLSTSLKDFDPELEPHPAIGLSWWQYFKKLDSELRQKVDTPEETTGTVKTGSDLVARAITAVQEILAHVPNNQEQLNVPQTLSSYELDFFRSPLEVRSRIMKIKKAFLSLSLDDKVAKFDHLIKNTHGISKLQFNQLHLLRKLVGCPFSIEDRTEPVRIVLSRLFMTILDSCLQDTRLDLALMKTTILNTLLSKNPWATTQYHIDSSLALVSILTSPSSPLQPGQPIRATYQSLTTLLRTVFTLHRRKIGGRYHLVVDALKGLLRCLYAPYATTTKEKPLPQPLWIKSAIANPHPLSPPPSSSLSSLTPPLDIPGPSESHSLARLLATLTSPAPSTLKPARPKNAPQSSGGAPVLLNDPTKKAKALAGQHLQYVLQEYCALQLQGRLEPEMRRVLVEQGVYAVLDVMSRGLRTAVESE